MRISTISKRMAEFKVAYGVLKDEGTFAQIRKYFEMSIRTDQVLPILHNEKIAALLEYWFVTEKDVERIKEFKPPSTFCNGNVCFLANLTVLPGYENLGIPRFIHKFMKAKFTGYDKVFWRRYKRGGFTKIFKVVRETPGQ